MVRPDARAYNCFLRYFACPHGSCAALNVIGIEKMGRGWWMPAGIERRRHQGEVAESEDGDVTPNLLLKHLDATFVTYI
jgi:hypothetical protein